MEVLLDGVTAASDNRNLVEPCKGVVQKFRMAFRLFQKCYKIYTGGDTSDELIDKFGKVLYLSVN